MADVCVDVKHKLPSPFYLPSIQDSRKLLLVTHSSIDTTSYIYIRYTYIDMSRSRGHRPPYDRPDRSDMYDDRPDEAYNHGNKPYNSDAPNGNDGF